PPVAFDDRFTTDENTPLALDALANDLEQDGNDFLQIITLPATSDLGAALSTTGTNITYDPAASATLQSLPEGSNRVDFFTYTLIDCCDPNTSTNWPTATGGRYTATNLITVIGINDTPTPQGDNVTTNPRLRTFEDRPLEIHVVLDLLANDSDPDTDDDNSTLRISAIHGSPLPDSTFEAISQLG